MPVGGASQNEKVGDAYRGEEEAAAADSRRYSGEAVRAQERVRAEQSTRTNLRGLRAKSVGSSAVDGNRSS